MGLIEGGLKVSAIIELIAQLISVDIGLINVLDSGEKRLTWCNIHLLTCLKLPFEEDLIVCLPHHRLFDAIPSVFGPQFLVLRLYFCIGGSWLEVENRVGLRCSFL